MTDFSNYDDVTKWLIRIKPEERCREVAMAFAARGALRVLPLLYSAFGDHKHPSDTFRLTVVLPVFRGMALPWIAARYPAHDRTLSALAIATQAAVKTKAAQSLAFVDGDAFVSSTWAAAGYAAIAPHPNDVVGTVSHAAATIETASSAAVAFADIDAAGGADAALIEHGLSAAALAATPLWHSTTPNWAAENWGRFKAALLAATESWEVWTDWYDARLAGDAGRLPIESLEIARATIPEDIWNDGPAALNTEIKRLIEKHKIEAIVPELAPGPAFRIGERGLEMVTPPPPGDIDQTVQTALQRRLKRLCLDLLEATRRVDNQHPELLAIISEYSDLITTPLEALDVASLWAVGTGLLSHRDAFSQSSKSNVTGDLLERPHYALLSQVTEVHGAFILGFPLGRELADRADRMRLSPRVLASILPAARALLQHWRHARHMVEIRTRKFLGAIEEGAFGPSWEVARAGYPAYVVTRNILIDLGKLLLHANSALATVVGGLALSAADPNLVQTQLWLQFALDESQAILAFAEPFPELRGWLGAIIDALQQEADLRKP